MNATDDQLNADAVMIVTDFVRLQDNETVAVFFDAAHLRQAKAVVDAVLARGNPVIAVDVSQQVNELLTSDDFWIDPPAHLHALIQATNVNIFVVEETYAFRLDHKIGGLFETGPACSIFKIDEGMGTWGVTKEDIEETTRVGAKIQEALDGAQHVRITSPGGTDLTLSLADRMCLPILPVPERGSAYALSVPLWGEYNWAPIEDSARGRLVIDGLTEAGKKMDVVEKPVVLHVDAGRVFEVEGTGKDAEEFRHVLATDAGSDVLGELGVGGNPKAIPGRETEKALLGTIHIGFGSNQAYPGGLNHSVVHFDGISRDVTIEADGRRVIAEGRYLETEEALA